MPDNLINHLNTLTPKLTIFLFYILCLTADNFTHEGRAPRRQSVTNIIISHLLSFLGCENKILSTSG